MTKSTAILFPGQGSQIVGMGKDIADSYPEARYVFEEIDEALNQKLSKIIFEGSSEELTATSNTQPALMATSMAMMAVLNKELNYNLENNARLTAGHSLGEYTALAAASSFSINTVAKLLRIRGNAMQEASPSGKGAMAALIGVTIEEAEDWTKQAALDEICQIANDNTIGQIVVSGNKSAINRIVSIAQSYGKRAMMLPVSGAFHSKLMAPATGKMREALEEIDIKAPSIPVIANVTAMSVTDSEEIKTLLVKQIESRVRWRESVEYMISEGITNFIEIGAGKVLSGLVKKINNDVNIITINDLQSLNNFMEGQ